MPPKAAPPQRLPTYLVAQPVLLAKVAVAWQEPQLQQLPNAPGAAFRDPTWRQNKQRAAGLPKLLVQYVLDGYGKPAALLRQHHPAKLPA